MNIGIICHSKTGNTKRLANIAKDEFIKKGDSVEIVSIDKYKFDRSFDLVILGTYCASNSLSKKFVKLLNGFSSDDNIACYVTHATNSSGKYYDKWAKGSEDLYKHICDDKKIANNFFHIKAKPSFTISLFIKLVVFKNARKDWDDYRKTMNDYPIEKDIKSFKAWINSLL